MIAKKFKYKSFPLLLLLGVVFVLFALGCNLSNRASKFTPEERMQLRKNLQVTENILAELKLIQEKKNTRARPYKRYFNNLLPRHVWHKARLVYIATQTVRSRLKLRTEVTPSLITQDLNPEKVYQLLANTLSSIKDLRQSMGIQNGPDPSPLPDNALSSDVYKNLSLINNILLGIDSRNITPNNVFQIAYIIKEELQEIQAKKGITQPIASVTASRGKHPRDVYKRVHELMEKFKKLSEKPNYVIPGNVELWDRKKSRIIPYDVIEILTNVLADVETLRSSLGLNQKIEASLPEKKTPSQVYDMVSKSIEIVETML